MKGIDLIFQERHEQLTKHNRTIQQDVEYNTDYQLIDAVQCLCLKDDYSWRFKIQAPKNWSQTSFDKMMKKPYKERLVIAGALIAAEIDRISETEK